MQEHNEILPEGTLIGQYRIEALLGTGGFGITYRARDTQLQRLVAIKEFLPAELAVREKDDTQIQPRSHCAEDYRYGLNKFLEEARTLARFDHPNIIRVHGYTEANGTAYLVMAYEHGETLRDYLKRTRVLAESEWMSVARAMFAGLKEIHRHQYLHRDIKPGNIYLRQEGEALLIDFGAARQSLGNQSRSVTGIVSAGYAPNEQYYSDATKQGPWTDLYGVGATLYRCISGEDPIDGPSRLGALVDDEEDPLIPAIKVGKGRYSEKWLSVVDWMLTPARKGRPQSIDEVIQRLPGVTFNTPAIEARSTRVTEIITGPEQEWKEEIEQTEAEPEVESSSKETQADEEPVDSAPIAPESHKTAEESQQTGKPTVPKPSVPNTLWKRLSVLLIVIIAYLSYTLWWPQGLDQLGEQVSEALFNEESSQTPSPTGVDEEADRTATDSFTGMEFIKIQPGCFQMGSATSESGREDDETRHRVCLTQHYELGQYEVTQGQWEKVMGSNPSIFTDCGSNCPVENVSWDDIQEFIRKLNRKTGRRYRLPTEAEWEYACRSGGRDEKYCGGNDVNSLGWTDDNSGNETHRVGQKRANGLGIYDMSGNVYEWVEDWYGSYPSSSVTDPKGPSSGSVRVSRGGSWYLRARYLRSAYRGRSSPGYRDVDLGFRLARTY